MLTRQAWPMALSAMIVGSVAVIVQADEKIPPQPAPAAGTATSSPSEESRKPIKPKELSDSVKKGLAYLVSQQNDEGGFGQGGGWRLNADGKSGRVEGQDVKDPADVGNTCMAALALIRAGNTPREGKYSRQLIKAVEFIEKHVESADKESMYVTSVRDTQLQSKIGRYVDTFLTALVLTELKGQIPDTKSEDRLFAALNKTIGKIEANQQADGTFAGNAGWASILSQGLCSKALNRAAQKGVAIKPETIKRDLDQSVAQLDTGRATGAAGPPSSVAGPGPGAIPALALPVSGPLSRASEPSVLGAAVSRGSVAGTSDAGVSLYSLSANAGRVQDAVNTNQARKRNAEAVVNSPTADDKAKETARGELKEVAAAEQFSLQANRQIVDSLSNDRFVKGFGNNGGEEFLSYMNISETLLVQGGEAWKKWDKQACQTISGVQNDDGSWSGHHCITGRTFCTSAALLTMMADRAPLPTAEAVPATPATK